MDLTRPGRYGLFCATGVAALLLLCIPDASKAQEYGIPPNVLRKQDLPERALLLLQHLNNSAVVTLKDGSDMRGELIDVTASDLTLLLEGTTLMEARVGVGWERISKVRIEKKSWLLEGALVGGLGGALVGSLLPDDSKATKQYLGIEASEQVWDSALQGIVAGALIGAVRGLDAILPFPSQPSVTPGPFSPLQTRQRPAVRLINTIPVRSQTLSDLEATFGSSPDLELKRSDTWNGQRGSTVGVETSWPREDRWWLRNRIEWTQLSRISRESRSGDTVQSVVWREYKAVRAMIGLARPFGAVGRLPFAEIAVLGGISRTTLKYGFDDYRTVPTGQSTLDKKERVFRPILMATGTVSIVRRPNLAVALRAEGVVGPGFKTEKFGWVDTYWSGEPLPKHRITPIGLSIGLEVLIPNF